MFNQRSDMPTVPLYLSTSMYLHLCYMVILNFARSWDFRFFLGILGFKVKMQHFEQPANRRVARKSAECCDFCWSSGPQIKLAFQRNWNSWKQSGANLWMASPFTRFPPSQGFLKVLLWRILAKVKFNFWTRNGCSVLQFYQNNLWTFGMETKTG